MVDNNQHKQFLDQNREGGNDGGEWGGGVGSGCRVGSRTQAFCRTGLGSMPPQGTHLQPGDLFSTDRIYTSHWDTLL